ncbi:MAG: FAD:protein FMN transferase [Planctomycetota bacterium]|nr:FAD:protein FMN transferase [Planctomycetota bacterium]
MRGLLVCVLLLLAVLPACAGRLERHEFARVSMGVPARIVLYAPNASAAEAAAQDAFAEIARLDAILSDYRRDSVVTRLGEASGRHAVDSPADLIHLVRVGAIVSDASSGAFDVTVAPFVRLWRASRRDGRLPDHDQLDAARALVDRHAVRLPAGESGPVMLTRAGMGLDFGGIAKGYAAQRAVEVLRERGHGRCLVSLAGDVVAGSPPPGRDGWHIEIRGERATPDAPAVGTLVLANAAVSTSGDAEQFVEIGRVRYAHIVDPRTGLGSTRRAQATVVAPRGEIADAIATAACLVPADDVPPLLRACGGRACVIVEGGVTRVIDPRRALRWSGPAPDAAPPSRR